MHFPDRIVLLLIDKQTNKPVKNIAVLLTLYAHHKNNYSIEAKISNADGKITFTKQDCLKGIETLKKFYLMDYSSTLEECLPKVSIEVLSKDTIGFVLNDRRKNKDIYTGYWNSSEDFLKSLESTDNERYQNLIYTFSESDLLQNKIINIKLERR